MGNVRSVGKALERCGAAPSLTGDVGEIDAADAVLLPGVGAFGDAMRGLGERGLVEVVRARAQEAASGGRPFLGVCLGMQVLVDEGDEDPGVQGLGVIAGRAPRIVAPGLKIPHMGWNELQVLRPSPLLEGLEPHSYVYFVHSFHVAAEDPADVAAVADHGGPLAAVLSRGNLFATQFHPEKSQHAGMHLLGNFVAAAQRATPSTA
jgi:glutamine amidotransferase